MPTLSSRSRYRSLVPLLLAFAVSGCVSLDSIRERDFDAVTIRQVEVAAGSGDRTVHEGLVALLEHRLAEPRSVSLDLTLETLVSLMNSDRADSRSVVRAVRRCATDDPNEEVRYLALDVLSRREGPDARAMLESIHSRDASDLVREHASELLSESSTRAPPSESG